MTRLPKLGVYCPWGGKGFIMKLIDSIGIELIDQQVQQGVKEAVKAVISEERSKQTLRRFGSFAVRYGSAATVGAVTVLVTSLLLAKPGA